MLTFPEFCAGKRKILSILFEFNKLKIWTRDKNLINFFRLTHLWISISFKVKQTESTKQWMAFKLISCSMLNLAGEKLDRYFLTLKAENMSSGYPWNLNFSKHHTNKRSKCLECGIFNKFICFWRFWRQFFLKVAQNGFPCVFLYTLFRICFKTCFLLSI